MSAEKPIKKCSYCGEPFSPIRYQQTQYCSPACRIEAHQTSTREYRRLKRHQNEVITPCQVCGFNETTDIHHEGDKLYILCPNHHALLSRGKVRIEEYNIIPIPKEELPKVSTEMSTIIKKREQEFIDKGWIKEPLEEKRSMKRKKDYIDDSSKCRHNLPRGMTVCLICAREGIT